MNWWLLGVAVVVVLMGGSFAFIRVKPNDEHDEKEERRKEARESAGCAFYFVGCILAGLSWALGAGSFWAGVGKFVVGFLAALLAGIIVLSQ